MNNEEICSNEEIYCLWAPEKSLWSTWAKPVLFAHLGEAFVMPLTNEIPTEVSWVPSCEDKTAIVLDLPSDEGIWVALALARIGYRPVPLYNALPLPFGAPMTDHLGRQVAAVNVLLIISALRRGALSLRELQIADDAPPVFMLDANRQGDGLRMNQGQFDNRSVCFTTDFPSANFLRAHGISKALLVERRAVQPDDLSHVLRRWQEGGIALERLRIDLSNEPEPFEVRKPQWFGAMFQRALIALGLKRVSGGGFGKWMPVSSAGG